MKCEYFKIAMSLCPDCIDCFYCRERRWSKLAAMWICEKDGELVGMMLVPLGFWISQACGSFKWRPECLLCEHYDFVFRQCTHPIVKGEMLEKYMH